MIRRLLTLAWASAWASALATASAVSLLLCVAVCLMWVRSYWVADVVRRGGGADFQFDLTSRHGRVVWMRYPPRWSESAPRWKFESGDPVPWGRRVTDDPGVSLLGAGWGTCRFVDLPIDDRRRRRYTSWPFIVVPYWPLLLCSSVLPASWCIGRGRRASRRARGLCPACGYDLRASPGRCPECGAGVTAS